MLTVAEVAKMLGVSKSAIYDLAGSRKIACYRFNSAVRFELADVEAYKAACRIPVAAPVRARLPSVSISSWLSNPEGQSPLQQYFRKMGIEPRLSAPRARARPGKKRQP